MFCFASTDFVERFRSIACWRVIWTRVFSRLEYSGLKLLTIASITCKCHHQFVVEEIPFILIVFV